MSIQDLTPPSRAHRSIRALSAILVCAAAILPYLPAINNYFVRDDFGVVQLLASKPASYFPRWFASSWMDEIWGFVPDEVRPFPALSYQLTALGGAASPILHHVVNILIHAVNGLLVVALARIAASLSSPSATFAGLVFVLLPVHTESVAWITGRVDSMPAFFYLASFLAYARYRERPMRTMYVWSLVIFFLALFSKQNTITMVGTLVAYDVIVKRRSILPLPAFVAPYIPFVLMTAGYLWLRYLLFGQVARESAINARGFEDFRIIVSHHLTHVITGAVNGSAVVVALTVAALAAIAMVTRSTSRRPTEFRALVFFGPVWWAIGVAPIVVAGYASPRHVYLAAAGWAIVLGVVLDLALAVRSDRMWRGSTLAAAAMVLVIYTVRLHASVAEWDRIAAVSHNAVRDVRSAALAAPEGTLLIVGAPARSWEWALPFAVRPPFAPSGLTERVFVISPRALSCCRIQWYDETRATLRTWTSGRSRDTAVALRWDADTGHLSRADTTSSPQLPILARALLDMENPDDLDRNLQRMVEVLTIGAR